MRILFHNSNTTLERELASDDYKAHSGRNRIAVLAVALTTVLFTILFTIAIGFVKTIALSQGAAPGPGADGCKIYGDETVVERVRSFKQVDWAALVKRCSATYLHNKEFSGLDVRLFAADAMHYDKNMVDLTAGNYPQRADEILVSDTFSERFGLGQEVGISYVLTVVIQEKDGETEQEFPMTVCGYYKNPLRNVKDIYEEIYTGISFPEQCNPLLIQGYDNIYVKLNNLNPFRFGSDKMEKLDELNIQAGGNGVTYKMSDWSLAVLIPVLLIAVCTMSCGYFFIFNVFDISIDNDIRFYGELKTIGMTSRQLRRMLLWQMNWITFQGIVIGCLVGFWVGTVASGPLIRSFAEGVSAYFQPAGFPETCAVSAVFAWITVFISTMKPFRTACMISPVAAARYRGRHKKGIFSVVSFACSGILFLAVYTLSVGYQVETFVDRYNNSDITIFHKATEWTQEEAYKPISQDLVQTLQNLDFVEHFRILYQARTKPDYKVINGSLYYRESKGEIANKGLLAKDIMAHNAVLTHNGLPADVYGITENERNNLQVSVIGMAPEYLPGEEKYVNVLEGKFDAELFATGDYILYQRQNIYLDIWQRDIPDYKIHAGDVVTISFYDDVAERYMEKTVTVMAVTANNDMFGAGMIRNADIVLTDKTFQEIYSDYANLVGRISFDVSDTAAFSAQLSSEQQAYETVQQILKDKGNMQLTLKARYRYYLQALESQRMISAFGIFLAVIVGLIGISNMINTVTTELMARKLEYAAMQSIGMTVRQMEKEIFGRYARFIFVAAGIAVIAGFLLTYSIAAIPIFTGFSLTAFVQAAGMFVGFSIVLCALMAWGLTKLMNRKSIVERLREL